MQIIKRYKTSSIIEYIPGFYNPPKANSSNTHFGLDITPAADLLCLDKEYHFLYIDVCTNEQLAINNYFVYRQENRDKGIDSHTDADFRKYDITAGEIDYYDHMFDVKKEGWHDMIKHPIYHRIFERSSVIFSEKESEEPLPNIGFKPVSKVAENNGPSLFFRTLHEKHRIPFLIAWLPPSDVICIFDKNLKLSHAVRNSHYTIDKLLNKNLKDCVRSYDRDGWSFEPIQLKIGK